MKIAFFAPILGDYSIRFTAALDQVSKCRLFASEHVIEKDRYGTTVQLEKMVRQNTPGFIKRLKYLERLVILFQILLFRPDFVISHENPKKSTILTLSILSWFFKIALIVHDPLPHSGRDKIYATVRQRAISKIRRISTMFLVHDDYCRNLSAGLAELAIKPIITINHGPVLAPIENAQKKQKSTEGLNVLMFGRMEEYKGLEVLVNAVEKLSAKGTHINLRVSGRGPELDKLLPRLRAIRNCVIEDKFMQSDEAISAFTWSDVVVVPYLEATQSGVVAAAFANSTPVIASRTGGLVDVVSEGNNGLMFEVGSSDALADALERLLHDPLLLKRLTVAAYESSKTNSWALAAGTTIRALAEIVYN